MVESGTTVTQSQKVGGNDHLTIEQGGKLSVSDDDAIKWKNASTDLVIDNAGVIESTQDEGRAINASGSDTAPRNLTLDNRAGAIIQSQDDAFRINIDVTGGTVTVNNAGTILSSVNGQAIDFDSIDSAGTASAKVIINNAATGVIQANGADAIRPGQGATVTNAGLIYSAGVIGDKNDGIDWQGHSGTVVNQDGGVISGQRHGITSDVDVDVYNAAGGVILGRNGSGVGSDGNGTVMNYGTITGAYVGTGDGDGDGIDIDGNGYVENWGTIQGKGGAGHDKHGGVNYGEGITITGGGTIINHAGATVTGTGHGITAYGTFSIVNDGTVQALTSSNVTSVGLFSYGAASIINTGTISSSKIAVQMAGDSDSTLTNSGIIRGGTGAILMDDGNDDLVIKKGSSISGLVDGGAGNDTLSLEDGAIFDTASHFEALQVDGAAVLTGDNAIASVHVATQGRLQLGNGGTSGSVDGAFVVDGVLAIDRSDTVTFTSPITGAGGVEQAGSGTTVLNADNTYTGLTRVSGGTLTIGDDTHAGASVAGTVNVAKGATLAGNGNIGGLLLSGTLQPGAVASTRTITGDAVFEKGSSVMVQSRADGVSRIHATGRATLDGGTVKVAGAAVDQWSASARYSILQADDGVTGTFDGISIQGAANSVFLTPALFYSTHDVLYALERNDLSFAATADSSNGRAAALAIEGMGATSPLYDKTVLLSAAGAGRAFDALSGEFLASTRASLFDNSGQVRDAINRHLLGTAPGVNAGTAGGGSLWTSGWGHGTHHDGDGNAAALSDNGGGVLLGSDAGLTDGARLGAIVGAGHEALGVNARSSSASVRSTYAGLYAGTTAGPGFGLRGGITYSAHKIESRRTVVSSDVETLHADYHARTLQGYVEGGYRFASRRGSLEPFVNLADVRVSTDGVQERGGEDALQARGNRHTISYDMIGLHAKLKLGRGDWLAGYADAGFQHAFAHAVTRDVVQFSGGESTFAVQGVPISKNDGIVDTGLDIGLSASAKLKVGYRGQFASNMRDQGGNVDFDIVF